MLRQIIQCVAWILLMCLVARAQDVGSPPTPIATTSPATQPSAPSTQPLSKPSTQQTIQSKLNDAIAAYESSSKTFIEGVNKSLDDLEADARKRGDKDRVDSIKEKRALFNEKGLSADVPSGTPRRLIIAHDLARKKMGEAYTAAIREFTRAGLDQQADATEKNFEVYRSRFVSPTGNQTPAESGSADLEASKVRFDQVVPITSKNEIGLKIGRIAKGEKLTLQYNAGRWKGWGRSASEDPDAKQQERGDVCRLAIAYLPNERARSVVIAIVPPGTQYSPFEWTAGQTYENLILRINDPDGDFTNNPDSGVTYRVRIIKP